MVSATGCNGYYKVSYGLHSADAVLQGNTPACGYVSWAYVTGNSSVVSWMSERGRAWVCQIRQFDQTYTAYNTNFISLNSPNYYYGSCGPQADLESGQGVNGSWSWWTYLNY